MAKLYIPVGLPGCGKTTYGKNLDGVIRVSSDDIREELFGDASVQGTEEIARKAVGDDAVDRIKKAGDSKATAKFIKNACNNYVFNIMDKRMEGALRLGKSVYYDATNLTRTERAQLITRAGNNCVHCVAVFFVVPVKVCMERNRSRERNVPEKTIYNMALRLDRPTKQEGFTEVIMLGADGKKVRA